MGAVSMGSKIRTKRLALLIFIAVVGFVIGWILTRNLMGSVAPLSAKSSIPNATKA